MGRCTIFLIKNKIPLNYQNSLVSQQVWEVPRCPLPLDSDQKGWGRISESGTPPSVGTNRTSNWLDYLPAWVSGPLSLPQQLKLRPLVWSGWDALCLTEEFVDTFVLSFNQTFWFSSHFSGNADFTIWLKDIFWCWSWTIIKTLNPFPCIVLLEAADWKSDTFHASNVSSGEAARTVHCHLNETSRKGHIRAFLLCVWKLTKTGAEPARGAEMTSG